MKRVNILLSLFFITIFVAIVLIAVPLGDSFEYDPDEGINVMKSLLFLKGFSLYSEIWSDQPPLLTYIMSHWFDLFGLSVYQGRLLILIFSAILLWAFYQIVKNSWGYLCAVLSMALLLLSAYYLRLSISIMVGLPALTFAMLSIYSVTLYKKFDVKRWLILSGIFMAFSLQTKLFTVFLTPLIVFEIIQTQWDSFKKDKRATGIVIPVMIWLGTFLAVYFCIALLFSENLSQLLQPHLKAKAATATRGFNSFLSLRRMIAQDYEIFLPALVGTILLIRHKKWRCFFPVAWFILAFTLLLNHKPVWYHHYLLLSIPLAWLAAICLSEFLRMDIRQGWTPKMNIQSLGDTLIRWTTAGMVIFIIIMLPSKIHKIYANLKGIASTQDIKVVDLLVKYSPKTKWVVTDRQIFPFYAKLPVPPELAVTSLKRTWAGDLTSDYFLDIMQKYQPEQILFNRYPTYPQKVMSYIKKNYAKVYHYKTTRLYIRKDLLDKTSHDRKKSELNNQ